jgi:hypothetical protein
MNADIDTNKDLKDLIKSRINYMLFGFALVIELIPLIIIFFSTYFIHDSESAGSFVFVLGIYGFVPWLIIFGGLLWAYIISTNKNWDSLKPWNRKLYRFFQIQLIIFALFIGFSILTS